MGWEYAEKLKDFVLERRAKSLKERGLDPKDSRLVVSSFTLSRVPQAVNLLASTVALGLDLCPSSCPSHRLAIPHCCRPRKRSFFVRFSLQCQSCRETSNVRNQPRSLGWIDTRPGEEVLPRGVGSVHEGPVFVPCAEGGELPRLEWCVCFLASFTTDCC